jgi:hypothetical protein
LIDSFVPLLSQLVMGRTRKRDDDSHYNSDTTSLAALDASSMSATGSRSSLTFASSTKKKHGTRQRSRKRQRKSLTDALQSISLDKDRGVPESILKMGDFPFSNTRGVAFSTIANGTTESINGSVLFGGVSSIPSYSDLNSKQQSDRKLDRSGGGADEDGDLYYDDDNSQLTSSTEENEVDDGMDDDFNDDEDDEDDEDSQRKKLANMTDLEKAQRKVMLELVFGKDHRESRKSKGKKTYAVPPIPIVDPVSLYPVKSGSKLSPLPFATISTRVATAAKAKAGTATATSKSKAVPKTATTTTKQQDEDSESDYKDPADRKIQELLRHSLKKLKEGSHPLQLPSLSKTDMDDEMMFATTPWKTQDDMTIDPQVYSPRMQQQRATSSKPDISTSSTDSTMTLDDGGSNLLVSAKAPSSKAPTTGAQQQPAQARPFRRQRSNSLPGGLDMMDTTAMDMDG